MARSAGATIEIVFDHFPQIAALLPQAVGEIVQETILDIETGAKLRAPVDTGALRASIQSEMTGETSGEVATDIEYSVFVEFGTVRAAAQPYMTPAAEAARSPFIRKMSNLESSLDV